MGGSGLVAAHGKELLMIPVLLLLPLSFLTCAKLLAVDTREVTKYVS